MLDSLANFCLSFSHETIIIPLLLIGYIWLEQELFFHAICLILVSSLTNFVLKILFQFPLSPFLGKEGFAFPSGHMQSSVALYGWGVVKTKKLLYKLLLSSLLIGIGLSLIYFKYHNYFDIFGAIFFGCLLIFFYNLFLKKIRRKIFITALFFYATFLMLYAATKCTILAHCWMAYYILASFLFSGYFFEKRGGSDDFKAKLLATAACFTLLFFLKNIFYFERYPAFVSQSKWLIFGFYIPFAKCGFCRKKS